MGIRLMVMRGKIRFSMVAPGHWADPITLHSEVLCLPASSIVSQGFI